MFKGNSLQYLYYYSSADYYQDSVSAVRIMDDIIYTSF